MVYRFMDHYKGQFGVRWLLRKFGISPNAYYNYRKHKKAEYEQNKYRIHETIKEIYYNTHRIIGHRGMVIFLSRRGISLSKTTVHKYMNRESNLHSLVLKKIPKYRCGERNKVFPNLLKQKFNVEQKNKIWCTDFTCIRMANGKIRYNCSIIDLYDRIAVSSVNSQYINTDLEIKALAKALENEHPEKGLILHSDQAVQFTSCAFGDYCKEQGIVQSMSRAGCPYDNAPMERFCKIFKGELIYREKFVLDAAVNKYIFLWYNHIRPHSYNGGLTSFEARYKD